MIVQIMSALRGKEVDNGKSFWRRNKKQITGQSIHTFVLQARKQVRVEEALRTKAYKHEAARNMLLLGLLTFSLRWRNAKDGQGNFCEQRNMHRDR